MENLHKLFTTELRLGDKGQLTLPKRIRDEYAYRRDDTFKFVHTASGEIILTKKTVERPEDRMLEIIKSLPKIDWDKVWEEVLKDRKKEHR